MVFGVQMLLGGEKLGLLICFLLMASRVLGVYLWITTAVCNSLTEKKEKTGGKTG